MDRPADAEAAEPVLQDLPARRVAYHPGRGSVEEVAQAMAHLQAWMDQQGLEPDGDAGIAYYAAPKDGSASGEGRWEVRCPVASDAPERPVDLAGCGVKMLEPVTVAVVRHRGPYVEIGRTYTRLLPWLLAHQRTPGWPMEEVFIADPEAEAPAEEPEAFLTEVRVPIVG